MICRLPTSFKLVTMFIMLIWTAFSFADANTNRVDAHQESETKTKPKSPQNVVVLLYHHVSSQTPASTSISPQDFERHMALLKEEFKVVSLDTAMNALKNDQSLPNKSVVITFDDGYLNILENAHPILKKYNFPYTIFVNPAIIGESMSQLNWQQIKSMQGLATFANHTLDHAHLLEVHGDETQEQWLQRVMSDINQAEKILEQKLGYSKKWIAYPYGEFNQELNKEVQKQGYIGFGQQSGAIAAYSDFGSLPRFPAAGIYAKVDSLKVKLNSLAMPIDNQSPTKVEYKPGDKVDNIKLSISEKDVRLDAFACYFGGDKLQSTVKGHEVSVQLNHKLSPGRARVNCTAPSKANGGRYYWYSYPMFTPTEQGDFLD